MVDVNIMFSPTRLDEPGIPILKQGPSYDIAVGASRAQSPVCPDGHYSVQVSAIAKDARVRVDADGGSLPAATNDPYLAAGTTQFFQIQPGQVVATIAPS